MTVTCDFQQHFFDSTHTQVAPQQSVLRRHPKAPPVVQSDEGLLRVPGSVLLQEAPLEVRQNPVHVH